MKNKSAFSMIELIFVLVVLGIITSIAMDRMDRDLKQEAAETILSHIRLAQQLALRDNKHRPDNDPKWQKSYWRFEYGKCSGLDEYYYRIGSDIDMDGTIDKSEAAINPTNGKYLYTFNTCEALQEDESPTVRLGKKFGIQNIKKYGGCSKVQHIAFDYLGRPHHQLASYSKTDFSKYMYSDCRLKFEMSTDINHDGVIDGDDSFSIIILHESGYAFIFGEENS